MQGLEDADDGDEKQGAGAVTPRATAPAAASGTSAGGAGATRAGRQWHGGSARSSVYDVEGQGGQSPASYAGPQDSEPRFEVPAPSDQPGDPPISARYACMLVIVARVFSKA